MAKRREEKNGKHAESALATVQKPEVLPSKWSKIAQRAEERRKRTRANLEDLGESLFGGLHNAIARQVMKPQVDDIVTEAVKEAYASGVAAALDGLRIVLASYMEDPDPVDLTRIKDEIDHLEKRLSVWKEPAAGDSKQPG